MIVKPFVRGVNSVTSISFVTTNMLVSLFQQEARMAELSLENHRLYTHFLSDEFIFAYQQSTIWLRKAELLSFSTIAINALYIDREVDNAY